MGSNFFEMGTERIPGAERLETEEMKYGAGQMQSLLQVIISRI